jgi:ACS family hexuronate transporter-like MFS transporter
VGLAVGNLAGGAVPRRLMRSGWSLNRSRKAVMFAASCGIPVCFILITRVSSPAWAVALIAGAMLFHGAWANITLPAEVFSKHVVGSVSGLAGSLGSLGSAMTMLAIGRIVAVRSFAPIFMVYSVLPMMAFGAVCVLIKKLGQVREIPA